MLGHRPDPDEILSTSETALDYARQLDQLAARAPEPDQQHAYGPGRGQWLDVYAPTGAQDLPVLLFFHGGAWVSGHLGWLRFMAPIVNALPAVFVAATYRLAPRCRWPAAYEDANDALSFVKEHAHEWGGDPQRLVVGGHSAGGHLAALLALRKKPNITACMPVSSSFDLQYGDVPIESDAGRVYRYLFTDRDQDFEASPVNYAAGNSIPFHITWGGSDFDRVSTSSAAMVALLRAEGAPVTNHVVPEASHFDTHLALSDASDAWYARLREAFAIAGAAA